VYRYRQPSSIVGDQVGVPAVADLVADEPFVLAGDPGQYVDRLDVHDPAGRHLDLGGDRDQQRRVLAGDGAFQGDQGDQGSTASDRPLASSAGLGGDAACSAAGASSSALR